MKYINQLMWIEWRWFLLWLIFFNLPFNTDLAPGHQSRKKLQPQPQESYVSCQCMLQQVGCSPCCRRLSYSLLYPWTLKDSKWGKKEILKGLINERIIIITFLPFLHLTHPSITSRTITSVLGSRYYHLHSINEALRVKVTCPRSHTHTLVRHRSEI